MEETLEILLRRRGIEERVISIMKDQKISMETITLMEPDELEKFLPKIGDRLAVTDFCSRSLTGQRERKHSLIDRLRAKLKNSENQKKPEPLLTRKKTRMVEIGWINFENDKGIQVRAKQGGGTRKISVDRDATCNEILEVGKKMFFPNGISKKGHISEFDFSVTDFKFEEVSNQTITEMFQITRLSKLRLYLTTKKKTAPSTVTSTSTMNSSSVNNRDFNSKDTEHLHHQNERSEQREDPDIEEQQYLVNEEKFNEIKNVSFEEESSDDVITQSIKRSKISFSPSFYTLSDDEKDQQKESLNTIEILVQPVLDLGTYSPVNAISLQPLFEETSESTISVTEPLLDYNLYHLILHRGNIVNEMIDQFIAIEMSSVLDIELYLPNGEKEKGHDSGGVFRDVLSEFWQGFFSKYTVGTSAKVPLIRHDFSEQKWSAVAKILVKGFKEVGYFPTDFAPTFLETCIFKKFSSDLTEDLLNYVAPIDANILHAAKNNFDEVDIGELLDCLSNLDCKLKPTKNNINELLTSLAHQELIQKPTFIIDCWSTYLTGIVEQSYLKEIYDNQKNITKNLIKSLSFDEHLTTEQENTAKYLKKFIRESDKIILKNFLRFVTGADMIIKNDIRVVFSQNKNEFSRTPTAQTCGCLLNLPETYESYPDFRNEFKCLLDSNIWIMDNV